MKKNRTIHLYIGIVSSVILLMMAITGLVLANKGMFMGFQEKSYVNPAFANMKRGEMNHDHSAMVNGELNITQAVDKVVKETGKFKIEDVREIALMNHGFGPMYYVALNDENRSTAVITMSGELTKIYHNPVTQLMYDWHVGLFGNTQMTWVLNVGALAMVILTGTGIYLSIKVLKSKRKHRLKLKQRKIA